MIALYLRFRGLALARPLLPETQLPHYKSLNPLQQVLVGQLATEAFHHLSEIGPRGFLLVIAPVPLGIATTDSAVAFTS